MLLGGNVQDARPLNFIKRIVTTQKHMKSKIMFHGVCIPTQEHGNEQCFFLTARFAQDAKNAKDFFFFLVQETRPEKNPMPCGQKPMCLKNKDICFRRMEFFDFQRGLAENQNKNLLSVLRVFSEAGGKCSFEFENTFQYPSLSRLL